MVLEGKALELRRQTSANGTALMYRPPIFFDAVRSQVLSDGNLMVQVEGKRRIALVCILFTGRVMVSVYQFSGGEGGGVSGHKMVHQMFVITMELELRT